MLGTANGEAALIMDGGTVSELVLRLSNLDIANSIIVFLGGDKKVPIRCLVSNFKAVNGDFQVESLLLETPKVDVTGSGDIKLEEIQSDRVEAHSTSGSISYSGGLVKNGRYEFQSHSGNVRLTFTGQGGFDSFNRYYFAQQDKQGAVIDERYNGGGSAADYIIDVLQRDFDGYFNNVAGERMPFTSPAAGIWGPKVMIVNEMAGSGGDLMPYMFKLRKIGPLVGKRTWGGLVHTADTPAFVDGGSMIAPRGGFFTRDGKWAVENEGVAPDIDVENFPKDVIAGHDPQLERAVEEAMRLLKASPVDRKTTEPPPPTWGKRKGGGS